MKFLVDAQLPKRLARWLSENGHESIHTLDLENRNASTDKEIAALADQQNQVVISKDSDFYDDHILLGSPKKLLVLKVGNISNHDLVNIFETNMERIVNLFLNYDLIELTLSSIIVHNKEE